MNKKMCPECSLEVGSRLLLSMSDFSHSLEKAAATVPTVIIVQMLPINWKVCFFT